MKKGLIIGAIVIVVAAVLFYLFWGPNLDGKIVIPYIAHQKPRIDPHLPSAVPIADKMDEVVFDGLFNVSANPSGITYEDGLGELVELDANNNVVVRLKPRKKWHESYSAAIEDDEVNVSEKEAVYFTAQDLNFTLKRIQRLGSLSPDYILVSQAVEGMTFSGPDDNNEIRFKFFDDRIWTEADIKEVLSFKILPHNSDINQAEYLNGTGPYLYTHATEENVLNYQVNPSGMAEIQQLKLQPFIDNSTYTTELKNGNINCLLSTPFGSLSPILSDSQDYFIKSNISTTLFAVLFNVERLSVTQRRELRNLIDNKKVLDRFYKVNTEQQKHIEDYKGNKDNYNDYLNYSIFPTSSYYVDNKVVIPMRERNSPDLSVLPDTVRIQTCLNYGFREELSELVQIMNDPALFGGKIKVTAVQNDEIKRGNYDAVLIAYSGYRSNFLYDLYEIFLREPDFSLHNINLITDSDGRGMRMVNERSFEGNKNFFRIDLASDHPERDNFVKLLDYIYGFMSTREVGDKQAYAQFLDELDQQMALGSWMFSLPSLAYFSTQFDDKSVDLYGVASQLSTIEKWREKVEK
ncbi:MAG: hypothetical protein JW956_12460 [Calditrichaceae bacterium]|nr:hypothetical protein [Calditrichaceae bacterium]